MSNLKKKKIGLWPYHSIDMNWLESQSYTCTWATTVDSRFHLDWFHLKNSVAAMSLTNLPVEHPSYSASSCTFREQLTTTIWVTSAERQLSYGLDCLIGQPMTQFFCLRTANSYIFFHEAPRFIDLKIDGIARAFQQPRVSNLWKILWILNNHFFLPLTWGGEMPHL